MTHNTSTNYAYKTWFDVMASFSPEVKKYRLEDDGSYFIDPEVSADFTQKKKSISIPKNKVFDKIHSKIISKGGGTCRSELYLDCLNVHKYYIHENEMKLELIRNSDEFLFIYDTDIKYQTTKERKYALKLKKVELHYKIIKPSLEIKEKHDQLLRQGQNAMIPFCQTELSHRVVHANSRNHQLYRIINGPIIPRKVFVMFLSQDNFNGTVGTNPFLFEHFDIKDITFKWNTRSYPADRYNMKWTGANVQGILEPYHHFMDAIGVKNGNVTNGISLQKFMDFFPVFVFDRQPDACNGAHTHIPESGYIDMEIEFNEALNDPIIALFYSQYDKILSWHRVAGKAGVDYPPKVSVLPNFDVKVNRKEEAVNF